MRQQPWVVDVAVAVVVAALLIIIAPGLAFVGMVALLVLVLGALTLIWTTRSRRRHRRGQKTGRSR